MTNANEKNPKLSYEEKNISQEQLQREVDYLRAQQMLESLLQNGLIFLVGIQ